MRLTRLKLANSIRIASTEETYLTSDKYDMRLENVLIHIRDIRSKDEVTTSLFNTIWFNLEKPSEETPPTNTKGNSKASSKA